jgi:hypothetical protein
MKREFLEKLGLGKAAIDAVMTEHGKSTEEARRRYTQAEEALASLREAAAAVTAERDTLQQSLTEATAGAEEFRNRVILSMVAEACPSSGMAKQELYRRLTEEALRGTDLREALIRLKESDPDAFRKEGASFPCFSVMSRSVTEEFPSLSTGLKRR